MSRTEFLESLATKEEAPAFDPCRCPSCKDGYKFDYERNMHVHKGCGKPNGAHRHYSPFCYECGLPFTYPIYIEEKFPFCPSCSQE